MRVAPSALRGLDDRRLGGDRDRPARAPRPERQAQVDGLADREIDPFADQGREALPRHRDPVRPEGQEESPEAPLGVRSQPTCS